jgi:ketosteroid isomerase-like protein
MNPNENTKIVMGAWKAFATCDRDRIGEFFHEDAEWIAPIGNPTAGVPVSLLAFS